MVGLEHRPIGGKSRSSLPLKRPVNVLTKITNQSNGFRIRARWAIQPGRKPIEDAIVECDAGRIVAVRKWTPGTTYHDLGDIAVMPGFVNVHSHIEYSLLRGIIEDLSFFPWIRELVSLKQQIAPEDWLVSAQLGAAEMALSGVTTLGDASDSGASVTAIAATGLRGIVFREIFGIESQPSTPELIETMDRKLGDMVGKIQRLECGARVSVGVSPHAPYTVRADLFRALSTYLQSRGLPQMIHVDESAAEVSWMRHGTGPFAEMYRQRQIPWQPSGTSSWQYLDALGVFKTPTVAVHCVQCAPDDALSMARLGVGVAHCPRSNAKLGAGIAPIRHYLDSGVQVGLGTDSPLTANAMDFFEEMRAMVFQSRLRGIGMPEFDARSALDMATRGGAYVLGLESVVGSLAEGLRADLIGIRLDGLHMFPAGLDSPEAALVYSGRPNDVAWTMVEGRIVHEHGHFPQLDIGWLRREGIERRTRIRQDWRGTGGT